jgi:hypothetical protein
LIILALSSQAHAAAVSLTPDIVACGSPVCLEAIGFGGEPNDEIAALGVTLLYKDNVSGIEDGPFQDVYETTYGNDTGLPLASAKISYVGGIADNPIIGSPMYALIKDGNLAWYLFDITGWNGTDDIAFYSFYGGKQGKISNVGVYGTEGGVPDGGSTAMLVGMALVALAAVRRRTLS